jgi:hypothetical protein
MSTSFLYHAFGIRGYKHVSTSYDEGKVTFKIPGYNGFRGAPFYWTMRRLSIMVGWKSITINYGRRYAQSSTKVNSP